MAATVPAQFAAGGWSVADADTSGDINITITTLPSNGGSAITALQYQIDGGSWVSLGGTTTGVYGVAGLTDYVAVAVAIRAVNAIGNGTASATKSVTPTPAAYVGPGDLAANALWYGGLRAYTNATMGTKLVRLRRSSDNAESDFNSIASGLPNEGYLDVAAIATWAGADNIFVVTLYDNGSLKALAFGSPFNPTQGTAGNQPSLILNANGSLPAMSGAANKSLSDFIRGANSGQPSLDDRPITVSFTAKRTGALTSYNYVLRQNGGIEFGLGDANNKAYGFSGTFAKAAQAAADNAWHTVVIVINGASSKISVDGSAPETINLGTTTNGNNALVTIMGDLSGGLSEIGVWPGDLL